MHHGALLPYRFGERIDLQTKRKTYDAITHVYYIGEWAFATGLTDSLKPRHVRKFLQDLYSDGVRFLHYLSDGVMIRWELYAKGDKVRAKVIDESRQQRD